MAHRIPTPNQQRVGTLKRTKRAYPPTEHDIRWADDLEFHAEEIEEIEEGMGCRALHFFRQMRQEAARVAEQKAMWKYQEWLPMCESEIEKLFLSALIFHSLQSEKLMMPSPEVWKDDPYTFLATEMYDYVAAEIPDRDLNVTGLLMQVPIHGYRADFVLYTVAADCPDKSTWLKFPLIVECDGHDFHDRTKEQAKRDRKRDRVLAAKGYQTVRFTGSELWRDPHSCVNDAFAVISGREREHYFSRRSAGA